MLSSRTDCEETGYFDISQAIGAYAHHLPIGKRL